MTSHTRVGADETKSTRAPSLDTGLQHAAAGPSDDKIDWLRCIPFILMHVALISVIWVGFSWIALLVALILLFTRVFGLTAFYHRYFSHRAFKTSRWFQFLGAVLGNASVQRGPLWWSAHHRAHHKHSDGPEDKHSPHQHGFLWSHMGWFLTRDGYKTDRRLVKDWMRFPELRFLDRFDFLVPLLLAISLYVLGSVLSSRLPSLHTSGGQMFVWGFLVSTVCLYHVTYTVNSIAHVMGSRRFNTKDHSRNNAIIAILTFGEGWHNNHHRYPASARQGFYWWEIDISYYFLVALSRLGLVWGLRPVPARILAEGLNAGKSSLQRSGRQTPASNKDLRDASGAIS
jgi:stearoyl-CoA desaturase (delta-9 desaturase)